MLLAKKSMYESWLPNRRIFGLSGLAQYTLKGRHGKVIPYVG